MSDEPSTPAASGRGLGFTAAQATVAAAALAVVSGIGGAYIQSLTTRDVEAGKSVAALSLEKTKVDGDLELERQKQAATADLARREFETKLILKAIETPDRDEAIRNLQFFLSAGFIQDKDGKIAKLQADQYPSITPPANVPQSDRRPSGQPPVTQEEVNRKIVEILPSFVEYSTRDVPGTNSGRLAAAWSVNEIVRVALGRPIGGGLSTAAVFQILRATHIERSLEQLDAGMIIVSPTTGNTVGHIGIIGRRLPDGDFEIYSNNSSKGQVEQNFTLKSWKRFFEAKQLPTHFYELNYKAFNGGVADVSP